MSLRKLAGLLVLVEGLQFLLGAMVLIGLQCGMIFYTESILEVSLSLVLLSSLLSVVVLLSVTRYQNESYQESMRNLENLNNRLREQRHDYLNQIQVVHGLLELGEYEEARAYLDPVFKAITKVSSALRTAQPAVNALLQAKMEEAERQGINFYLEIGTLLDGLLVEPWELCKIMANLIDNAVTAVSGQKGERRVVLQLREFGSVYECSVKNNGPCIPREQQRLLFTRGYTTKKGEGHGMGLAIVEAALREAGGTIEVESGEEETCFRFTLPRRL